MEINGKENYKNPARYTEGALREKEMLRELNGKPFFERTSKYIKLTGPGFLGAAMTLGAGSFASSIVLGASYGYKMLWCQHIRLHLAYLCWL